jgi:hypothetical protein
MLTMRIFQILDSDSMGIGDSLVLFQLAFSGAVCEHKLLIGDQNNRYPSINVYKEGKDILEC